MSILWDSTLSLLQDQVAILRFDAIMGSEVPQTLVVAFPQASVTITYTWNGIEIDHTHSNPDNLIGLELVVIDPFFPNGHRIVVKVAALADGDVTASLTLNSDDGNLENMSFEPE